MTDSSKNMHKTARFGTRGSLVRIQSARPSKALENRWFFVLISFIADFHDSMQFHVFRYVGGSVGCGKFVGFGAARDLRLNHHYLACDDCRQGGRP